MPLKESEAIVLRSYPLREADLLVTFFTRAEGKVRGVAKAAKKSRRRFGGALEPLTWVRLYWEDRERQELARIDSCDVLESPLTAAVDYPRALALAHVAEVLDELLPDREANDAVFRLALSVLSGLSEVAENSAQDAARAQAQSAVWMPLTYFDLWMTRLMGYLPELGECIVCGRALNGSRAFYHALADGLMCAADKRLASSEMSPESRALAAEMFRLPVTSLENAPWPRQRAADLRRFLVQIIERHIEKKLITATMLQKLE